LPYLSPAAVTPSPFQPHAPLLTPCAFILNSAIDPFNFLL